MGDMLLQFLGDDPSMESLIKIDEDGESGYEESEDIDNVPAVPMGRTAREISDLLDMAHIEGELEFDVIPRSLKPKIQFLYFSKIQCGTKPAKRRKTCVFFVRF